MRQQTLTDYKNERRAKRKKNRSFSTYLLEKHGIPFVSQNNGAHLIVGEGDFSFDFYPGTGLFKRRPFTDFRHSDRGIFNLLELFKK